MRCMDITGLPFRRERILQMREQHRSKSHLCLCFFLFADAAYVVDETNSQGSDDASR